MLCRRQKRHKSVKVEMGVYRTNVLTYFDRKHCCVSWIWYPCGLNLELQYLKKICELSWLKTLNIRWKLNFRINDHLEFQALCKQKSQLLLSIKVRLWTDLTSLLSAPVLSEFNINLPPKTHFWEKKYSGNTPWC